MDEWIKSNPENQSYFNQFKTIWDTSKTLTLTSEVDENKAWDNFQSILKKSAKSAESVESVESVKSVEPLKSFYKVAASIILIAAIGIIGYLLYNNSSVEQLAISTQNNTRIDTLSDGSVITLNKASSLSYPSKFKGDKRVVALQGEAFFNITPNKKMPFIISVDSIEVTVVGTSFNIKEEKGSTEVVVETGIVQVRSGSQMVELRAGERLLILAGGNLSKEKVTDKLYNYYRSKEFVCDNTPLWKLVEVINQAYESQVEIGREELKNLPMNATFNNESLDQLLKVISLTFDIKVTKRDNRIILE